MNAVLQLRAKGFKVTLSAFQMFMAESKRKLEKSAQLMKTYHVVPASNFEGGIPASIYEFVIPHDQIEMESMDPMCLFFSVVSSNRSQTWSGLCAMAVTCPEWSRVRNQHVAPVMLRKSSRLEASPVAKASNSSCTFGFLSHTWIVIRGPSRKWVKGRVCQIDVANNIDGPNSMGKQENIMTH